MYLKLPGGRMRTALIGTTVVALAAGLLVAMSAVPAGAAAPAAYTSINPVVDLGVACGNGSGDINCNIFDTKDHVWLNAGPDGALLPDGRYFFAVTEPGGQGAPIDSNPKRLSSDSFLNRTFTVTGGQVDYAGTHTKDGNKIRLADFGDALHGVYQMSICELPDPNVQPDNPSCKSDAFKVKGAAAATEALPLDVSKTATFTTTTTYSWRVDKKANKSEYDASASADTAWTIDIAKDGGTPSYSLTGTITVVNPNEADVVGVNVADVLDMPGGPTCTVDGGQNVSVRALDASAFGYSCAVTGPLPPGTTNTATATWSTQTVGGLQLAGASATATVPVAVTTATVDDSVTIEEFFDGHDVVGFTPASVSSTKTFEATLPAPVEPGTCRSVKNEVTITGSDSKSVRSSAATTLVCGGADLTVSKTATPAFSRRYDWQIAKSALKTSLSTSGSSATADYSVTATQTGITDSAWTMSGVITVTNPNDWEPVTLTGLTDLPGNGGSCSVTGPVAVTLAAKASKDFAYTCTWSSAPSTSAGANTATVTWDKTAAFTPHGAADGTKAYDFAAVTPASTSKTVTVTDTLGSSTTTLGTLTGVDAAPFTSKTYSYSRALAVPATGCVPYENVARITQTGQSATATVTVCKLVVGGHTIGFWRNKNGQALILGSGPSTGACPTTTWLRQYAPFQDLSATASCTALATYVTNVIDAASAAGPSMNAMLKAQMLATALSVRLYSPPLGTTTVNITAWSGGFAGATVLTVNQMLSYAASQSNAGGSLWYGQVKATQGSAKDAFDAINNNVAVTAP